MLRAELRDGAVAAAKAWSHGAVEPRHVAYAIALRFRHDPRVAAWLERTRRDLEPRGTALEVPGLTEEAEKMLAAIGSPEEASAVLAGLYEGDRPGPAGPAGEAHAAEAEGSAVPEADARADGPADGSSVETVADVLAELDGLVGLETVKEEVRRAIAVVQANRERAAAGLPTVNPGLHLVFSGAPGTGKTTVARLIARLYSAAGALPGSNFTEVDRSDLVAGYVGQTALRTSEVIRRTLPGVLFIDEAYSLAPTHESDFGAEAISTLVKAMEDHRHELAVIVAGYPQQMSDFLSANPGLRSRLKTFIDFPDYGADELVRIFEGFANDAGLALPGPSIAKAREVFEQAVRRDDFGNARFARSLFEGAYARMAIRAAADGTMEVHELTELAPDDLTWKETDVEVNRRRIGFGERGRGKPEDGPTHRGARWLATGERPDFG